MRVRRPAREAAPAVGGRRPSVQSSSPLPGAGGGGTVGGRPVHEVVCDSAGVDVVSRGAGAAGAAMSTQLSSVVPCAQHCGASESWSTGSSGVAVLNNQPEDQDAPQRYGKPSYKEVLLRQRGSVHQEGKSRHDHQGGESWPVEDFQLGRSGESCHVAKAKSLQLCTEPRPDSEARQQEKRRSLYLQKMKGLCFNCLDRDHKVTSCRNPTRCWRCRRFGHVSTECPSRRPKHPLSNSSQGGTLSQPHITRDADTFIDDVLLHIGHNLPPTASERSPDPMLLEALMSQRRDTGADLSTPPATATPLHVDNQRHLCEEMQTPVLLRSEAEQLVGEELIKALCNFKQVEVAPLSPRSRSRQNASHEKDPNMVYTEGTKSFSHHRKAKIKSRKCVFKVRRDLLTKKWIFVKKEKQLRAPKVANLLEELRLPPQLCLRRRFELFEEWTWLYPFSRSALLPYFQKKKNERGVLVNWSGLPAATSLYAFCFSSHPVIPKL
ncbi:hypothetical protein EJB05_43306, partial [Eragrostis curvula]